MDQDKRSAQAIDPALLDRARKAWAECWWPGHGWKLDGPTYDEGTKCCDLHAAIARALEEFQKEMIGDDVELNEFEWPNP